MNYVYKFQKVLALKENEKNVMLADYNQSVKEFENVAEQLYELLKKKENLDSFQKEKLSKGLSISEIRHQQSFLSNLDKTITYYQGLVIKSRNKMQELQGKLLDKNIEVKKYEKLNANQLESYLKTAQVSEMKKMDELSMQQFMNRGTR